MRTQTQSSHRSSFARLTTCQNCHARVGSVLDDGAAYGFSEDSVGLAGCPGDRPANGLACGRSVVWAEGWSGELVVDAEEGGLPDDLGSAEVGSVAGTWTWQPHLGQLSSLPEAKALTRKLAQHLLQLIVICIGQGSHNKPLPSNKNVGSVNRWLACQATAGSFALDR